MRLHRTFLMWAGLGLLIPAPLPAQRADTLTVEPNTVMAVSLNTFLTTKNARPGDNFHGEVLVPVTVAHTVAIPKGAVVTGRVVNVKRSGRVKGRAEMALAFEKIIFPDGFTSDISLELKGAHGKDFSPMQSGDERVRGDTAKGKDAAIIVSTASGGAGLGSIVGLGKGIGTGRGSAVGAGAGIGAGAGAVAGLVTVLATRGPDLILDRGTQLDLVLKKPFLVEKVR